MDEPIPVVIAASMALIATYYGDAEDAARWLTRIPRAARGELKIALDDLDMTLSRLGRAHG